MKTQFPIIKIGKNQFRRDADVGFYPIFSYEINRRVKNKEACVIVVVGEAGTSKSYTAIQLARNIDARFGIGQIVFTYSDYIKEIQNLHHAGIPIIFDEPSYAMSKREWYKEINQALVKTIESQRFLVRPLIIPIINISLLDKTLRDYLIIFQVHMIKRGKAMVYRTRASQGEDKVYRYLICNLDYPILDFDKCPKEREAKPENKNKSTCLSCRAMRTCDLLRAQYERKKEAIQMSRYAQDEETAKARETKELTDDQLLTMLEPYEKEYYVDEKASQVLIRTLFKEKLGMRLSMHRASLLKNLIEYRKKNIEKT